MGKVCLVLRMFSSFFILIMRIKKRIVKNNYKQKIHLANQKKSDSDEKNALFVKLSLKSNPIGIGLCE